MGRVRGFLISVAGPPDDETVEVSLEGRELFNVSEWILKSSFEKVMCSTLKVLKALFLLRKVYYGEVFRMIFKEGRKKSITL